MTKLLIYSDSSHIGGHELLSLEFIKCLAEIDSIELFLIISHKNIRFFHLLSKIKIKEIVKFKYSSGRLQGIRSQISYISIMKLRGEISRIRPDMSIVLQGNIEYGSLFLKASKVHNHIVVSYIPIVESLRRTSKNKFIGCIKDAINQNLYKIPNYFITINDSLKSAIEQRVKTEVFIVKNGIEFSKMKIASKESALETLGWNKDFINVIIIGRIEFNHKGQDTLLKMLYKYRNNLKNYTFHIIGDGSDRQKLLKMIEKLDLKSLVYLYPWSEKVHLYYSACDLVILPSRYEGTPLTILEAIFYNKIVIASNINGINELLPGNLLFDEKNIDNLFQKLIESRAIDKDLISSLKNKFLCEYDIEKFRKNFTSRVLKIMENEDRF